MPSETRFDFIFSETCFLYCSVLLFHRFWFAKWLGNLVFQFKMKPEYTFCLEVRSNKWVLQATGWKRETGKDWPYCILLRVGPSLEERHFTRSHSKAFWRDWWRWEHSTHWNVLPSNRSWIPHNDGNWYPYSSWSIGHENAGGSNKTKYLLSLWLNYATFLLFLVGIHVCSWL